jgi:hypothetical protein
MTRADRLAAIVLVLMVAAAAGLLSASALMRPASPGATGLACAPCHTGP